MPTTATEHATLLQTILAEHEPEHRLEAYRGIDARFDLVIVAVYDRGDFYTAILDENRRTVDDPQMIEPVVGHQGVGVYTSTIKQALEARQYAERVIRGLPGRVL